MSTPQFTMGPFRTFEAAEAIAEFIRVKVNSSGQVAIAGVNEEDIGVTWAAVASGGLVQVKLRATGATTIMTASGAITLGNPVFPTAAGKVGGTRNGPRRGIAFKASGANADQIEVFESPEPASALSMITHLTAATTLLKEQSGQTFSNLGAAGALEVTLPQDAPAGTRFHFCVMAAQQLQVSPGAAGALYINGAKQADDKHAHADDEGEHMTVTADGNGDWVASPITGTWTVES